MVQGKAMLVLRPEDLALVPLVSAPLILEMKRASMVVIALFAEAYRSGQTSQLFRARITCSGAMTRASVAA